MVDNKIFLFLLIVLPFVEGIVFTNTLNTLVINEELPVGTLIVKAETNTPADSFSITGTAATYFAINITGHIVIKQRIDREQLSFDRITGNVIAMKNGSAYGTASFRCIINDINDNVPFYPRRLYEVSISESTSIGTVIFKEQAVDGDEGLNGAITYSIASVKEENKLNVDIHSGDVSLASSLDYERTKEYIVNITARDVPGLSNWTMLLIHVLDTDDLPAKFTAYSYSTTIREDVNMGSPIYQVKAYDLDYGINGTVSYAIDQDINPFWLFSIDNNTGLISLNGSLDRESVEKYTIRVLAHSSFPFSDHATIVITVLDVNDNVPVFSQPIYNATTFSGMNPGVLVVQGLAVDNDKGINAKLRYSIQPGANSSRFNIDYQTGKISTAVTLNREDKDSYELTVVVQDMDGNSTLGAVFNDTATVFVSVKAVADVPPVSRGCPNVTGGESNNQNNGQTDL